MLDKHLVVKTNAKADEKNVLFWKNYRVSVLGDRLFRLERSESKKFRDGATLAVWFRNMPPQSFTKEENEDKLVVQTAAVTLIIKEKREDCRIVLRGEEQEKPIDNTGNLKGTYRTLDRYDGEECADGSKIALEDGVCSLSGVAVYDDSNVETLHENGEIVKVYEEGSDEYVFAFGKDYKGAIRALYSLCGAVPLIPRFALGNWWSRYHEYTDEEYLTVLHRFREREIPLSVATVDMDWHYSLHLAEQKGIIRDGKDTEYYMGYKGVSGWTGYSWNTELFPDYKAFLQEVKAQNLKITLNLHPADGVRYFEDMYADMAKAVGVDEKTEQPIAFDIFDPVFANAYFSVLHKPYEKDGVDFWWIDWQQGVKAGALGIDPLWALNHYHYLDNAKDKKDPLILSRYAGVGSHRYPVGFSGDTYITWKTLEYLPRFTATASNVGYGWWSHDIGGHMSGEHNGELYLRHAQYGVFSPINRYHSSNAKTSTKEPWAYKNGTGALIAEQMRFRHKLVPYLYTCAFRAFQNAEMLCEPLYYYHQDDKDAYRYPNEYYFGRSLLVAPVVTPEEKDVFARVKVWLPKGEYTDIFTGDEYRIDKEEGEEKTLLRTLESIPVLAKSGSVLPLSEERGNGTPNPKLLTVKTYCGNGSFELYEDGREEGKEEAFFTLFKTSEDNVSGNTFVQRLEIQSRGDETVIPKNRVLSVRFENIQKGKLCVAVDGKPLQTKKIYADCVCVDIDFVPHAVYTISVTYDKKTKFELWKQRVVKILSECEYETNAAERVNDELQKTTSWQGAAELLKWLGVPEGIRERLTETM